MRQALQFFARLMFRKKLFVLHFFGPHRWARNIRMGPLEAFKNRRHETESLVRKENCCLTYLKALRSCHNQVERCNCSTLLSTLQKNMSFILTSIKTWENKSFFCAFLFEICKSEENSYISLSLSLSLSLFLLYFISFSLSLSLLFPSVSLTLSFWGLFR